MKYVKSGTFTSEQLNISETICKISDTISIAKSIIEKLDTPKDIKKELAVALNNLTETESYLPCLKHKSDIALKFVPESVQTEKYL